VRVVADVFTPVAAVSSYKETEVEWVKTNHVKRALREGAGPAVAASLQRHQRRDMSRAGFDWLLIDMEHGHGDYQTLLAQLQAIEGSPVIPIVRVQWNDPAVVKRVLDLGAYGS
jgi:2-keto-3-deoxy-L-rhamnonate aldolase RhmA